jgi:uncharacterized protein (UPF0218 family)
MADDGEAGGQADGAGGDDSLAPGAQPSVVVSLPESLRGELTEPMGPVYTEPGALLADAGKPVVAVGDIVTYHLLEADARPAVALVDGKTEREAISAEVSDAIDAGRFDHRVTVRNPAATLTRELLEELGAAVDRATAGEGQSTVIEVTEGEEDLAALPALVMAPDGAAVVYGQPDEGMVLAAVDGEARSGARDLLERMDGDVERLRELLDR